MDLTAAALPIRHQGTSDLGILLIHGFTSTPGSVSEWAEGLHKATGATVVAPLLPGHGTRWEDLNTVTWQDWEKTVLAAWDELAATHKKVAVGGLSLGGALALLVALRRPATVALLLVNHLMWLGNPALPLAPLIKRLTPSMAAVAGDIKKPDVVEPAYDRVPTGGVDQFRLLLKQVKPLLPTIQVPTLMFKSRQDHVIPVASTLKTMAKLGSTRKDLVWLEHSYHVATMDYDLPLIVEQSARFLKEIVTP